MAANDGRHATFLRPFGAIRAITLILGLLPAGVGARAAEGAFNVDCNVGWGGCYRPMEWTPVDIGIQWQVKDREKEKDKAFGGVAVLSVQQDPMTTLEVRQPFVVTPESPVHVSLAVKIAFGVSNADLNLQSDSGRSQYHQEHALMYSRSRGSGEIQPADILIGTLEQQSFGLGQLGGLSSSTWQGGDRGQRNGRVFVKSKFAKHLPWDWTGYASLDLLVLYNPKWEDMANQAKAIREWVSNGGRVLIVLGAAGMPSEGPIAELLPFKPAPRAKVALTQLPNGGRGRADVSAWVLPDKAPAGWSDERFGAERPLWMCGPYGFGKVGVLAFDPTQLPDTPAANRAQFWIGLANQVQSDSRKLSNQVVARNEDNGYNRYGYGYESGADAGHTNNVVRHLYAIPELKPLHIGWVIALLALLAVLLGPVDYLVLKKLDRLPLTWITSAAIIAVFTVGAYFGVQALRAGSMQVRAVTVLDGIADADGRCSEAWSTHFCGIFAPDSDVYRFEKVSPGSWWASVANENEQDRSGGGIGSRRIYCTQRDGSNLPAEVPISIWSMQCLVAEGREKGLPFTAKVLREGRRGGLSVEITNTSTAAIRGGQMRMAGGKVWIGRVEPGQTRTFKSGQMERGAEGYAGEPSVSSFAPVSQDAVGAHGAWKRTEALEGMLRGSRMAVVEVAYDKAPLPYEVNPRDYQTDHVQIARMVVPVAKEE